MNINDLVYNEYVQGSDRTVFLEKVIDVSRKLGINPNWLMAIMWHESARSFSATIPNPDGCIGLIQFCGENINTFAYGERRYNRVAQLDGVYEYFKYWKSIYPNALDSFSNMYMITFLPAFLPQMNGASDDTLIEVLPKYPNWLLIKHNSGFDYNKDGKLTVGDWKNYLKAKFDPRVFEDEKKTFLGVTLEGWLVIGAIVAVCLLYRFRKPIGAYFKRVAR